MDPVEAELQAALGELERARIRPYYDAEADKQARDQYYAGIATDQPPAVLYEALGQLVRVTHGVQPGYKPARELYPWVDLCPNLKVRSVYSGKAFAPEEFIRADLEMEARRPERVRELTREATGATALAAELDRLEAAFPYNCEHVVPQSWFQKREPMRGDLHHLFACEPECNSFRGNTPYFDFADFEDIVRSDCGKREERKFEPNGGKGAVARAVLYFLLRYPGEVGSEEFEPERLPTLLAWHAAEPPGEYERHRNQAIQQRQGNRNPLIDHGDWAERIDFAAATPTHHLRERSETPFSQGGSGRLRIGFQTFRKDLTRLALIIAVIATLCGPGIVAKIVGLLRLGIAGADPAITVGTIIVQTAPLTLAIAIVLLFARLYFADEGALSEFREESNLVAGSIGLPLAFFLPVSFCVLVLTATTSVSNASGLDTGVSLQRVWDDSNGGGLLQRPERALFSLGSQYLGAYGLSAFASAFAIAYFLARWYRQITPHVSEREADARKPIATWPRV
jgi:endonuclease I